MEANEAAVTSPRERMAAARGGALSRLRSSLRGAGDGREIAVFTGGCRTMVALSLTCNEPDLPGARFAEHSAAAAAARGGGGGARRRRSRGSGSKGSRSTRGCS